MVNDSYKNKAKLIVSRAKEKGLVKDYSEFCKTPVSKKNTLSSKEVSSYTSKRKEVT